MMDVNQLTKGLKEDLRIFYEDKKVKERLKRIMSLFDPDREDKETSDNLVCLIDSLNNIDEAIKVDFSEEKHNYRETKKVVIPIEESFGEKPKVVIPFEEFFGKKPKDEISEEEIEEIKQKIRGEMD